MLQLPAIAPQQPERSRLTNVNTSSRLEPEILEGQHDILLLLEKRLGRLHARQRLGIEREHEGQVFGGGVNFFHIENWYSIHSLIRYALKMAGLLRRGINNTAQIQV